MSDSTGGLPLRPRVREEQKQQRGTFKRSDRQTRGEQAHAASELAKDFESPLTPSTLYCNDMVGHKTLHHRPDPFYNDGESSTAQKTSLDDNLRSPSSSAPTLSTITRSSGLDLVDIRDIAIVVTALLDGAQVGSEKTFGADECTTLPKLKSMVMQHFGARFRELKLSPGTLFDGLNLFAPYKKTQSFSVTSHRVYFNWFNANVSTAPPGATLNIQVKLREVTKDDEDEDEKYADDFWFDEEQRKLRNPADGIDGIPRFFEEFGNQGPPAQEEAFWKRFRRYEAAYHKMKALHIIASDESDVEEEPAVSITRGDGRRCYGGLRVPGY